MNEKVRFSKTIRPMGTYIVTEDTTESSCNPHWGVESPTRR